MPGETCFPSRIHALFMPSTIYGRPFTVDHGPWTMENRYFYVEIKNAHFSTPVHPFELIPVRFCIIFRGDSFQTIKKYFCKK